MNNTQEIRKEDNDSKKIFTMLVLIFTLMVCTTGATYAYFALSATNNVMTGTAANASLSLSVSQASLGGTSSGTTQTNVMVPQLESTLGTAMGANYKCVDGNGNLVCKVYTITVTNTSTAAVKVVGTIKFSGNGNMGNLKWRKVTNATTLGTNTSVAVGSNTTTSYDIVAGTACTVSTGTGCTSIPLAKSTGSATYYIVIWINETETSQSDSGTWRATVRFEGENGTGITSTITS